MPRSNDKSDTSFYNQQKLDRLKSLRENVNWEMEDERRELFRQIYPLVRDWHEQLPNLRDIFQAEEMDHLLWHSIDYKRNSWDNDPGELFVKFVARSGYRDEAGVDEAGKQSLNRTTPIHRVARRRPPYWCLRVADLFQIYQRFDANYSDESGFTHFHAACMSGCERSVEKFLELGRVDPNLVWRETGESPLHLALEYKRMEVFQSLMRYGADPTLANEDGSTPLHVMCKTKVDRTWVSMLLALSQEKGRPIRIDARDKSGNTPLHLALACCNNETVEWLMRRTDLNSANAEGSTPLHLACQRRRLGLAGLIFEISDEKRQAVRLDARDNLGRTPLQWAVANLEPDAIDVLLNRGADLSNLVFPTESYFGKSSELQCRYRISLDFKVALAADALAVVERLEKRGYELDRGDALTIMRFFAENRMFQKSAGLERLWCDGKKFAGRAKKIAIRPSLTLYELIRLRPEEAAKLLTYSDYYQLWKHHRLLLGRHEAALVVHLCEKMSRGFFRSWALDSFAELTRQKLPIELCQIIFGKQLMNKDFRNICLAASGRNA